VVIVLLIEESSFRELDYPIHKRRGTEKRERNRESHPDGTENRKIEATRPYRAT
jgi:hypothetical protein